MSPQSSRQTVSKSSIQNKFEDPNGGRVTGFHSDMFAIAQVAVDMDTSLVYDSTELGVASTSRYPFASGENGSEHT